MSMFTPQTCGAAILLFLNATDSWCQFYSFSMLWRNLCDITLEHIWHIGCACFLWEWLYHPLGGEHRPMGFELDWHPGEIREKTLENHGFFWPFSHGKHRISRDPMGWHHWIPVSSTESYRLRPVSENVTFKVSWCVTKPSNTWGCGSLISVWKQKTCGLKNSFWAHTPNGHWKPMGLWQCSVSGAPIISLQGFNINIHKCIQMLHLTTPNIAVES